MLVELILFYDIDKINLCQPWAKKPVFGEQKLVSLPQCPHWHLWMYLCGFAICVFFSALPGMDRFCFSEGLFLLFQGLHLLVLWNCGIQFSLCLYTNVVCKLSPLICTCAETSPFNSVCWSRPWLVTPHSAQLCWGADGPRSWYCIWLCVPLPLSSLKLQI
jgi:hypothetical protein